jgi:exoribonuclease II
MSSGLLFAETMQCVMVLNKAQYYSNLVQSELHKSKVDYCNIADYLEQQLNWLGSAEKYCTDYSNIQIAKKIIRQLSPILVQASIKCGH